jgi:hypothetical protein
MRIIVYLMMRSDPRQEPYEGKSHVRICAGGREVTSRPYRDTLMLHLLTSDPLWTSGGWFAVLHNVAHDMVG